MHKKRSSPHLLMVQQRMQHLLGRSHKRNGGQNTYVWNLLLIMELISHAIYSTHWPSHSSAFAWDL